MPLLYCLSLPLSLYIRSSPGLCLSVCLSLALPKQSGHPGKRHCRCQMAFLAISTVPMHPFSRQTACKYLPCFVTGLQLTLMCLYFFTSICKRQNTDVCVTAATLEPSLYLVLRSILGESNQKRQIGAFFTWFEGRFSNFINENIILII